MSILQEFNSIKEKTNILQRMLDYESKGLLDVRQLQELDDMKHGKPRELWGQEEIEEHTGSLISDSPCYRCLGRYKK